MLSVKLAFENIGRAAIPLTAGLVLAASGAAYAGPKVDVTFELPLDVVGSGNPKVGGFSITRVDTQEKKTIGSYSNPSQLSFQVQSGFGPKLFKMEWKAEAGGQGPLQVLYMWIDVPADAASYVYEIPFHVVTFERAENKVDVNIGALSSRTVEQTQLNSKQNTWVEPIHKVGSIGYWKTSADVAMLAGCYSIFTYTGDDWPVGYSFDYVDDLVCVGADTMVPVDNP